MPLERIGVPVFVAHHQLDDCKHCRYADLPRLMNKLTAAPRKELLTFSGGISRGDPCEARAYHGALGIAAERIPVIGLKSYFGMFDAGSGAVELAASVLALRHVQIPFTLNYEHPDPHCRLNVVHHEPLDLEQRTALSVNRTAIGQSAAAIIRSL